MGHYLSELIEPFDSIEEKRRSYDNAEYDWRKQREEEDRVIRRHTIAALKSDPAHGMDIEGIRILLEHHGLGFKLEEYHRVNVLGGGIWHSSDLGAHYLDTYNRMCTRKQIVSKQKGD